MPPETTEAQAQAQETTTPETSNQEQGTTEGQESSQMSSEDAAKEIARLRKEAARHRIERNEARLKLEAASKADRTEAERIEALEKELADSRLKAARTDVANGCGLPVEFIVGSNREEMESFGENLTAYIQEQVEKGVAEKLKATPPMPVVSGENTGRTPVSEGDWLRQAFTQR